MNTRLDVQKFIKISSLFEKNNFQHPYFYLLPKKFQHPLLLSSPKKIATPLPPAISYPSLQQLT
jgi:hypothetical protein